MISITFPEIIQQFLNVYDLKWEKSNLDDPGMLPSSWMNCKQVHADGDPDLGKNMKRISCGTTRPICDHCEIEKK